jgi:flavin-dependent dehydrogenase
MLDAIVIGAGPAGLSAARYLHDRGHKVVVLEAQDRVGGRIFCLPEGGMPEASTLQLCGGELMCFGRVSAVEN